MKTLVAFGCSFTYGDELVDPNLPTDNKYFQNEPYRLANSYPGRIAEHYNLQLLNTAFPGASLESMRWTLDWLLNKSEYDINDCMLIVGHTQAHRHSWFDPEIDVNAPGWLYPWNQHKHGSWLKEPGDDLDWYNLQRLWMKKSLDFQWEEYNLRQTVQIFEGIKLKYNIPVVQFKVFDDEPAVDLPEFTFQQIAGDNLAKNGHPNEKGHQLFAEHLINYMDSVKILEC